MVSAWVACTTEDRFGNPRLTRKDAKECAESGAGGVVESVEIRIDGVTRDTIAPKAKLGTLQPNFDSRPAAIKSYGAFIAPNSLAPGLYTASVDIMLTPEFCATAGEPYPCSILHSSEFDDLPEE